MNLSEKAKLATLLENLDRAENGFLEWDAQKQIEGLRHLRGAKKWLERYLASDDYTFR